MLKEQAEAIEFAVATEVKPAEETKADYDFEAQAKRIAALVEKADSYGERALKALDDAKDKFKSAAYSVAEFKAQYERQHGSDKGWRKYAEELTGLKASRLSELLRLHEDPEGYEKAKEAKAEAQRRFQERRKAEAKAAKEAEKEKVAFNAKDPEARALIKDIIDLVKSIDDVDQLKDILAAVNASFPIEVDD